MRGTDGKAPRVRGLVLVLIPTEGLEGPDIVPAARIACGTAMGKGHQPMNPVLHYGPFNQYEDVTSYRFLNHVTWWHRRAERLWLCSHDGRTDFDDVQLDALTYTILFRNENLLSRGSGHVQRKTEDPMRKPVHMISWRDSDQVNVRTADRRELSYLLQINIVSGLLRGMTE